MASSWAAEGGLEIRVDSAGPTCAHASAWLCDPSLPSSEPPSRCHDVSIDGARVGAASGGFLARADELRVQFEGFADPDSGVGSCRLEVIKVPHTGQIPLGQSCTCLEARSTLASPCGCAPSPSGRLAVCRAITESVLALAADPPEAWRMSYWSVDTASAADDYDHEDDDEADDDDFSWLALILESTGQGTFSACIPSDRPDHGTVPLSAACESDEECASLEPSILEALPAGADPSVKCVELSRIPWQREPPAQFCCGVPNGLGVFGLCLPVATAWPWLEATAEAPVPPSPAPLATLPVSQPSIPPSATSVAQSCTASLVEIRLTTSSVTVPGVEFSHVSWTVDSALEALPHECLTEPPLCGGPTGIECGCVYRASHTYSHHVCLSPGRHWLTLEDRMGFGWLGAHVSVYLAGSGQLITHDEHGTPVANATVPSPAACYRQCAAGVVLEARVCSGSSTRNHGSAPSYATSRLVRVKGAVLRRPSFAMRGGPRYQTSPCMLRRGGTLATALGPLGAVASCRAGRFTLSLVARDPTRLHGQTRLRRQLWPKAQCRAARACRRCVSRVCS